ncbi:hypothetical protein KAH55_02845 [bacterium]|nr:hypothetical protein [bacterium]
MQKLMTILTILVMASAISAGNPTPKTEVFLAKAEQNYNCLLTCPTPSVCSDAMLQVMKFKARYPERVFSAIESQLVKMSQNHTDLTIRIQAHMTHTFLNYPEFSAAIDPLATNDGQAFFNQLFHFLATPEMVAGN